MRLSAYLVPAAVPIPPQARITASFIATDDSLLVVALVDRWFERPWSVGGTLDP